MTGDASVVGVVIGADAADVAGDERPSGAGCGDDGGLSGRVVAGGEGAGESGGTGRCCWWFHLVEAAGEGVVAGGRLCDTCSFRSQLR